MRVLDGAQMREADRRTIEEVGIDGLVLMENAGRQVVAAIEEYFPDLAEQRVAVVCGRGNNGGDGFVVARTLHQRGVEVSVFVAGALSEVRGNARDNLEALGRIGLPVVEVADAQTWELHRSEIAAADLIVDALLGTGLSGPVTGLIELIIADLNAAGIPIVSIDLPSGLLSDSCEVPGQAIDAVMTVTLGAPKYALVLPPGERHVGRLVIADIGIPRAVVDELAGPRVEVLERENVRGLLPARTADAHKGDFGHVLVVAGSIGKTGAATLCARGALRAGAGLVTVATPRSCLPIVATATPEIMTEALPETAAGTMAYEALEAVLGLLQSRDVLAIGPGLSTHPDTGKFVRELIERSGIPIVIDADALNAFAGEAQRLRGREGIDLIVTPHPGEMARLLGASVDEVQTRRLDVARDFAQAHALYVILKGHRTIVASPDGHVLVNSTGNPGMASGGTGDVLTGMVAGFLAQVTDAEGAAVLGVYVHGAAGDLAEAHFGEVSLTASDVIDHIGAAIVNLQAGPDAGPNHDEGSDREWPRHG